MIDFIVFIALRAALKRFINPAYLLTGLSEPLM